MKRTSLEETLKKTGIMVIDGSMSTALEEMGCQLSDNLWTAKILANEPEKIRQVHYNYFCAGADCGITASYQATIPGFMSRGYSRQEAEALIAKAVELFLEARSLWWEAEGRDAGRAYPMCLGAVGPYGAYLADGSEYRGNYGVSDETLREFHRRRMEILWESGADMLLIETQPSLNEALIAAGIAEELGADYWISFSCKDETHICEGDEIRTCAEILSKGYPHLKMIGVNCTTPMYISSLLGELKSVTDIPVGLYPNSGDAYDPKSKTWTPTPQGISLSRLALRWMAQGANAVGGCCTTVASHIREITAGRDLMIQNTPKQISALYSGNSQKSERYP